MNKYKFIKLATWLFMSQFILLQDAIADSLPEIETMNSFLENSPRHKFLVEPSSEYKNNIANNAEKNIVQTKPKSLTRKIVESHPLDEFEMQNANIEQHSENMQKIMPPTTLDVSENGNRSLSAERIKTKDHNTQGLIIQDQSSPEIVEKKIIPAKQASEQEIKMTQDLLKASFKLLEKKATLSQKMLNIQDSTDINQNYDLAKNFGNNSRRTAHNMLQRLANISTATTEFKESFTENLIQQQLDHNFGIDTNSFESLYSLKSEQKASLQKRLLSNKYEKLFNVEESITNLEKLQLIAQMNDDVMNVISGSLSLSSEGVELKNQGLQGFATFSTTFDTNGDYRCTISSSAGGETSTLLSVVDNTGKQKFRGLRVGNDEFRTDFRNGWLYGYYKTSSSLPVADPNKLISLTSTDGQIFTQIVDLTSAAIYFKSLASLALSDFNNTLTLDNAKSAAKTTVKVGLSAGKQAVIYFAGTLLPYNIPIASAALLLPIVKIITLVPEMRTSEGKLKTFTGYQFTGYSWQDPTMLLVAKKAIDIAVGDNGQNVFSRTLLGADKPLLSKQEDRIFRKGTWVSNSLQWLQGKKTEQEDQMEQYVEAIGLILQTAYKPLQMLFPQTLGNTILSQKDLQQAASAA